MPFAEHDNVVKSFPPDRTDRPFTISVLPRRSRRGWPIPNAHRPKTAEASRTPSVYSVHSSAQVAKVERNPCTVT